MRRPCEFILLGAFLALCSNLGGTRAFAATPSFTVSATNVTMPLSQGSCNNSGCTVQFGSSTFTLTSVNGYTGALQVICAVASPPAGAMLPTCFQHGLMPALPANKTITGEILFLAPGQTPPPSPAGFLNRPGRAAASLALAATLLFGLGARRRAARWFTIVLLALGALGGLAAISACGGNSNSMTPGTYSYAITATDANGLSAATTISVTIP
jgi:hypothetical protein